MTKFFQVAAIAAAAALTACGGDTDLSGRQPVEGAAPAAVVPESLADTGITPPRTDTLPAAGAPGVATPGAARETATPQGTAAPAPAAARPAPARPASGRKRVVLGTVDLTEIGYDVGSPDAPVTVINFSDFGCPYCAKFSLETYPALEREYVRTGKVYFKYVPFVMGMFPNGDKAARASECAADQGKFWQMHDRIYEAQTTWKRARDPWPALKELAQGTGLDVKEFTYCVNDHRTEPRTRRASRAADDLGVRATPSFAINGRPVEGALPLADFRRIIEAALLVEEARQP